MLGKYGSVKQGRRLGMVPLTNALPGLLPPMLPQSPRSFQLPIPLGKDLFLLPFQLILGGYIPKGTMKTDLVVIVNIAGHQTTGIF